MTFAPLQNLLHLLRAGLLSVLSAAALLAAAPAGADELRDLQALLRQGKTTEALARIEKALAERPKDAQLRFLKGVALTDSGKAADAAQVFTGLTQDFPELPEPYNNLAAILASQGAFDKARVALEMAIRLNPGYAVAHENLGDVYARLAAQAWNRSLELEANNAAAKAKLALVRDIIAPKDAGRAGGRPAR